MSGEERELRAGGRGTRTVIEIHWTREGDEIVKCEKIGCRSEGERAALGGNARWLSVVICDDHGQAWDNDTEASTRGGEETVLRVRLDAFVSKGDADAAEGAARALLAHQKESKEFARAWMQKISPK